jgi:hypothetical protein
MDEANCRVDHRAGACGAVRSDDYYNDDDDYHHHDPTADLVSPRHVRGGVRAAMSAVVLSGQSPF